MSSLQAFEHAGTLVVDSRLVAERLNIDHSNFLETVENYRTQIEQAFGIIPFETEKTGKRGRPQKFALLNEDQASFVMTLSSNTPEVIECKLQLVQAFSKAKELLRHHSIRGAYWYERIKVALSDAVMPLQGGYFCAYLEMMKFFQQLETHAQYVVPDLDPQTKKYIVPDISVGKKFNTWLRSEDSKAKSVRQKILGTEELIDFREERWNKDKNTGEQFLVSAGAQSHEIAKYNHVYPESSHGSYNIQPVSSYPEKYLPIFNYFLANVWIPEDCDRYISERDSEGWKGAIERLMKLPSQQRQALSKTLIGSLLPSLPEAS
jgi:phage regulator Rha-like protein